MALTPLPFSLPPSLPPSLPQCIHYDGSEVLALVHYRALYSPVGVATAFAIAPLPLHERYVLPNPTPGKQGGREAYICVNVATAFSATDLISPSLPPSRPPSPESVQGSRALFCLLRLPL